MEIRKQSPPEWLKAWLRLPFYDKDERCKKHVKQYNTVYCGVCRGRPVCEKCWKVMSEEHKDHHQILQVVRASGRAAIDIKDISKLLDISDIQQYKINGKHVLFLNPQEEGIPIAKRNPNCERCSRRLMSSNYRYCSIRCKNKRRDGHIEKNTHHPEKKKKQQQQQQPTLIKWKMMSTSGCCSLHKRSRKGIPQRAPLK